MRFFLLTALLCFLKFNSSAQNTTYLVEQFLPTSANFLLLTKSNAAIKNNDTINERIMDLANAYVVDSILQKKKNPHHRVFLVGWGIHTFGGYNWRKVYPTKGKLVGTVFRQYRSGREEFTEFDVNLDLKFHLKDYLYKSFYSYDQQRKYKRQDFRPSHHTDYNKEPFVRDTNNINIERYRIHAELTPPRAFRSTLNDLFYPIMRSNMKVHYNFLDDNPSVGMYGAYCLDCNHNCHPELHPYEWLWWMKLTENDSAQNEKNWYAGLMREGSARFKEYVNGPRTGGISIPFTLNMNSHTKPQIQIEHILMNDFVSDSLKKHFNNTYQTINSEKTDQTVQFMTPQKMHEVRLTMNLPLSSDKIKIWFDQLNYDDQNHLLSGYIHFFTSVKDVYCVQLTTKSDW